MMSNHYHIVVRIDAKRAATWSVEEVLELGRNSFPAPYSYNAIFRKPGLQ
ncbi:hypothetical protein CCP3SC15_5230004 [Gammaproteobacteria bacterium]